MVDNKVYSHTLRICNTAFLLQQWLSERAIMLHYSCIVCLVVSLRLASGRPSICITSVCVFLDDINVVWGFIGIRTAYCRLALISRGRACVRVGLLRENKKKT